jgi:uncharacterized protein YcgI (DUF1989 family)
LDFGARPGWSNAASGYLETQAAGWYPKTKRRKMKEYIVQSQSGIHIRLTDADVIKIIDLEGEQVVDFFAINAMDLHEIFSPGVTIDCNASLAITKNDCLYTNLYHEMFKILDDPVGKHDLIHPCCRPEMYDHFYQNGLNHPNCFENINALVVKLGLPSYAIITPLNIFMNTKIEETGKIHVLAPLSKPGDYLTLKALMPVHVFLAACSVSESECNGGRCTPIKVIVNP